ncbi:MAG: zinc-binding dehydrogenase, partial [Treponema sp.]|nr:zinc-binding dehydrogenase [Treponema sp.]
VGLGPVGLAALMLCRAIGARNIYGIESSQFRIDLANKLGLADKVLKAGPDNVKEILDLTGGKGVEKAFDASASDAGRQTAIRAARQWGKIAFIGEGGTVSFNPSPDIIHQQKSIYGSWVTSIWLMENLVEELVRWNLHPDALVTHRFPLEQADEAYRLMNEGNCGKVAVCQDEALEAGR